MRIIRKIIRAKSWEFIKSIWSGSLNSAAKEQGLKELAAELEAIVPDVRNQYTGLALDNAYLKNKVRYQHAFQISLVEKNH